mmetsp:Transcript_28966/g.39990  ORF Transcript_28966/g.39990 Transcript_28966/m.39990 type:complete len:98 (+) Transcript_28966:738-1031(+)
MWAYTRNILLYITLTCFINPCGNLAPGSTGKSAGSAICSPAQVKSLSMYSGADIFVGFLYWTPSLEESFKTITKPTIHLFVFANLAKDIHIYIHHNT